MYSKTAEVNKYGRNLLLFRSGILFAAGEGFLKFPNGYGNHKILRYEGSVELAIVEKVGKPT